MVINIIIIIILVILVLFSAFFSGSEIIYASANQIRLKKMAEEGNKKAQAAWNYTLNYPVLISTILIGNNLVNIAASSLATVLFTNLYPENGALIAMIAMTTVILIFGEILPKTILQKFSTQFAIIFSSIIKFMTFIFKPLVSLMTKMIKKLSPIWTPKEDKEEEDTSEEELKTMVDTIEEKGFIDNDTKELVTSAIELKDTTAQEIMTPRVDIFAFDINDDLSEVLKDEDFFTYSRVLVYEDTIDNVIGVLNTRKLIINSLVSKKSIIKEMLITPIYVHKTKSLISILKVFRETHTHIAIVVDEFGGTLGIITLEDVLEEIVGDIWDEMDEAVEEYEEEPDGTYIATGDMNIDDLFEKIGYENEDYECAYSTIGGWCTEILDAFPKENDTFTFENYKVTILKVDGVRVEKVKIEKIPEEE